VYSMCEKLFGLYEIYLAAVACIIIKTLDLNAELLIRNVQ
jgi:hypothetical protein